MKHKTIYLIILFVVGYSIVVFSQTKTCKCGEALYIEVPSNIDPINQKSFKLLNSNSINYPYFFAVISDVHYTSDDSIEFVNLLNLLKGVKIPELSFIISTGDLVHCSRLEDYKSIYNTINENLLKDDLKLKIPFFIVSGNHEGKTFDCSGEGLCKGTCFFETFFDNLNDLSNSKNDSFKHDKPNFDFYFDFHNCRFLAIKNIIYKATDWLPDLSGKQIAFIDSNTKNIDSKRKFCFSHAPILRTSLTAANYDYYNYFNTNGYIQTLLNNKISANFHGHVHEYHHFFECDKSGDNNYPGLFDITVGSSTLSGAGGPCKGTNFLPYESQGKHPNFIIVKVEQDKISTKTYFTDFKDFTYKLTNLENQFDFSIQGTDILPAIMIPDDNVSYDNNLIHLSPFPIETNKNTITQSFFVKGRTSTQQSGNVKIRSMKSVTLNQGFYAEYGSSFLADIIIDCDDLEKQTFCNTDKRITDIIGEKKLYSESDSIPNKGRNKLTATIYPNPNDGSFNIDAHIPYDGYVVVEAYNILGSKVLSDKRYLEKGVNRMNLKIDNASNGIYLINLKTEKEVFNRKIVVR